MVLAGGNGINIGGSVDSSRFEMVGETKENIEPYPKVVVQQINQTGPTVESPSLPLPSTSNSQSLSNDDSQADLSPQVRRPLTMDNNSPVQPTVLLVYEKPTTGPSSEPSAKSAPTFQPARVISIQSAPVQAEMPKHTATYDMASNVGARAYYAGVGVNVDVINPRGHTESNIAIPEDNLGRLESNFNNTASGAHLSPKIFVGIEQEDFYKGWGLRLQAAADFHTVDIQKKDSFIQRDDEGDTTGLEAVMKFRFNYTLSLTAQLKKKIINNLDGYVGLSLLATWAQIAHSYFTDDIPADSGEANRFIFGVSPSAGLLFNFSDKMFGYLEGHVSFYQRASYEGTAVAEVLRFDTRMEPIWAGIGVGIGWKL